jgi:hypothetical protein
MLVDLDRRFDDPPRSFSPVPIWWWSGEKLDAQRLLWQLERFAEGGVYNLLIMNLAPAGPLYGCDADDPPYFSQEWWTIFRGVCKDARALGVRIWSPYTFDLTDHLRPGENALHVSVYNTLGPYMEAVSPTSFVFPGQTVSGLFGPVTLTETGGD